MILAGFSKEMRFLPDFANAQPTLYHRRIVAVKNYPNKLNRNLTFVYFPAQTKRPRHPAAGVGDGKRLGRNVIILHFFPTAGQGRSRLSVHRD
jgi:hypothetical protein